MRAENGNLDEASAGFLATQNNRIGRKTVLKKKKKETLTMSTSQEEGSMKRITWQSENCLSCVWFLPNDPINADLYERGKCIHTKLKGFDLIVSGRDWCNLYKEITQKHIDFLQERAMNAEEGKSESKK